MSVTEKENFSGHCERAAGIIYGQVIKTLKESGHYCRLQIQISEDAPADDGK
jgi:hypothetical protein